MSFENISELAAMEIEDGPLWDGRAKSSRYQDFSRSGFVTPPELTGEGAEHYRRTGQALPDAYRKVHAVAVDYLSRPGRLTSPGICCSSASQRMSDELPASEPR